MKGKLQIQDQTLEIETRGSTPKIQVTVQGKEYMVQVEKTPDGYRCQIGETHLDLALSSPQLDALRRLQPTSVEVGGTSWAVRLQPQRSGRVEAAAPTGSNSNGDCAPAAAAPTEGAVSAFMPGHVRRVMVKEGDLVESGQVLLILEAMKMENEVKAPIRGVVKQIAVSPGVAVVRGGLLLQIAPAQS